MATPLIGTPANFTSPSTNTQHDIPYTIPSGTSRLTVVRIAMPAGGGTAIQSVMLDPAGLQIPLVLRRGINAGPSGQPVAAIYVLPESAHPAVSTYTIRVTISGARSIIAMVETRSGVDQTGMDVGLTMPTVNSTSGAGATAALSVSGATGGVVLDCLSVYASASTPTITPDAAQSPADYSNTIATSGGGAMSHKASAASVSMSWAITNQANWAYTALPLASANTAPVVTIGQKATIGSTIYLPVGATIQLSATVTDPDPADSGLTAAWSSGTPAYATVDAASGLVTAVAEGTSVVTASAGPDSGGATGTDSVTIVVDNTPGAAGTGFGKARFIIHALGGLI